MTSDCLSCRHFQVDGSPRVISDDHTFGRCCHPDGPKHPRTTTLRIPVSTNLWIVSDGMSCERLEARENAA